MDYDNGRCGTQLANAVEKSACDVKSSYVSPTLAQNIDMRLKYLATQISNLERVKTLLAEPGGILNVPIDDLRFAMNH